MRSPSSVGIDPRMLCSSAKCGAVVVMLECSCIISTTHSPFLFTYFYQVLSLNPRCNQWSPNCTQIPMKPNLRRCSSCDCSTSQNTERQEQNVPTGHFAGLEVKSLLKDRFASSSKLVSGRLKRANQESRVLAQRTHLRMEPAMQPLREVVTVPSLESYLAAWRGLSLESVLGLHLAVYSVYWKGVSWENVLGLHLAACSA